MIPQIFHLGPIPLNSFGLMIALAILAGNMLLERSFKVNGINPKLAEKYALTGAFVGLVGARLWYVFIDFYDDLKDDLLDALLSSAGFTFYGGFIISTIVLITMSRFDKIPFRALADSVGPCLTLGYAIGRLACQLSGDGDYGIQTSSILGMSYSSGVIPTAPGVLVFPTPLYESIFCFGILFLLLKAEKNPKFMAAPLSRFGLYLSLVGLERFLIEFLRINPKILWGFSEAQIIAIPIILIGTSLFVFCKPKLQARI